MDFIKFMFNNRKKYLVGLAVSIFMAIKLKQANLFIEKQEIGYYIAVVMSVVILISFIVGVVYLSITDYIMYKEYMVNKK